MNTLPISQASATTDPTSSSGLPTSQSLNNMFLQLLVAQLQNQSPLNPMDPSQFVGQLAQFSELSEVTSIYQLLAQGLQGSGSTPTKPHATPVAQAAAAATTGQTGTSTSLPAGGDQPGNPTAPSASPSALMSKIQGAF